MRKPSERGFPPMLVGYMRVSTDSDRQVLDLQRDALVAACVDERHLFEDRGSGSRGDRIGLAKALAFIKAGDCLVVGLSVICVQKVPLRKVGKINEIAPRAGDHRETGVKRRWRLAGMSRWLGEISVHTQNQTFRYRPRTGPEAACRRRAATTAFADFCSCAGSPGNWLSLR